MHIIKIKLNLLRRLLRSSREINRIIDHLSGFFFQVALGDGPLLGIGYHLVGSTDEDPVSDFVPVFPVRGHAEFLVGADFVDELREGLVGWGGGGFLGVEQVGRDPCIMDAGLGEGFGDDGWLFEFDSKSQVN
jgi:hypothetical protein